MKNLIKTAIAFVIATFAILSPIFFFGCADVINIYETRDVSTKAICHFRTWDGITVLNRCTVQTIARESGDTTTISENVRNGDTLLLYVPYGGIDILITPAVGSYVLTDSLVDVISWTDGRFNFQYYIGDNKL